MTDYLWKLNAVSTPHLKWGAVTARATHECPYCHIPLLTGERAGFCCGPNGKYNSIRVLPPLPPEYGRLITDRAISQKSRILNLIFSFAAIETTHAFPNLGHPSFLAIQGKVYHRVRPTHRNSCLRWLLYDGFMRDNIPFPEKAAQLPPWWIIDVKAALLRLNPLIKSLKQLSLIDVNRCPEAHLTLQDAGTDSEIAAILNYENTTTNNVQPRNMVCVHLNGDIKQVPLLSRNWEPLAYPLLFPQGTLGWGMPANATEAIQDTDDATQMWYYRFRVLHDQRFQIFGRLTNEYLVDMFSRNIESRLAYIRQNQDRIRQADAALMGEGAIPDGDNVYLPASFLGSNRWASEQIADALAIAAALGNPTFFITMTCNAEWDEIVSQCRPGQNGTDIPITVARVFHQKVQRFIKTLKGLFPNVGPPVYIVYSIEFQKRGYPHIHILLKYPKTLSTTDIDNIISAERPSDPADAAIVDKYMYHHHSPSYCLKNRPDCRFRYPFDIREVTEITGDGRVLYRRRSEHDANIVPHVLILLKKYLCHINTEVASTSHLFQYLFKYVYKGPDYARYTVSNQNERIDEIEEYWRARYLTGEEAAWRILGYHVCHKEPAVTALSVHLPSTSHHHMQYHRRSQSGSFSTLLRYFHRPTGSFRVSDTQLRTFDSLTYIEYFQLFRLKNFDPAYDGRPSYFREIPNDNNAPRHHVILRSSLHVARLQPVLPSKGELFYFRTLLQCRPGRSFDDFRQMNGVGYDTYQEAACAAGMFADENEAEYAIVEAIMTLRTPRQLRYLFIHLLTNDCIRNPISIWDTFVDHFAADFILRRQNARDVGINDCLIDLAHILEEHGRTLADFGLPEPEAYGSELEHELRRWEPQIENLQHQSQVHIQWLTDEQKSVYNAVMDALHANIQLLAYIDGKAGRGKTWVIKCICEVLRAHRNVVLATATSAFAAQQYEGGRTTHATFKVPVNENNEFLRSPIEPSDKRAELLKAASLIIWDEVPMANRTVLTCVDETLQRVMNNATPFGGKSILLAGDFRQTCPVIKGGNRARVVDASVRSAPLWSLFTTFRLHAPYRNAQDPEFAAFVDAIGDGAGPQVDLSALHQLTTMDDTIDFVYPSTILPYPELCVARNILAPTNAQIDEYNEKLLDRVLGIEKTYYATDKIREVEEVGVDTAVMDPAPLLDYAARRAIPGLPAHRVMIKTNGVYRLLRNFSIDQGLVKNVRVRIVAVGQRVITVRLLPNSNIAHDLCMEDILIPRISFTYTLPSGYTLLRRQFPLAPAYATTFNSCQGLTLDKIGVDLTTDVFSHGQLYTALSRVRHREAIGVRLKPGQGSTTNITYPEILLN